MQSDFMFTSESVTAGHPDKLCDQISDAIVGRFLRQERLARVDAECAVSTGIVFISVKFGSSATVDVADVAREVIEQSGYDDEGFDARRCTVMTSLHEFIDGGPPLVDERTLGDDEVDLIPARHQATVFGFACAHGAHLMPLPIWLAHKLAKRLAEVQRSGELGYLAPDGKTQVGVEFHQRRPRRIHSVTVLASQKRAGFPGLKRLQDDVIERVVGPAFADEALRPDARTRIVVNPEGPFIRGGPAFHAGLTGRKTAVDTYGEFARHSGAALSGKDPSRIDRVGAYAARHAAKNVVAARLADQCELQLSYSVGLASPVSVNVETYGSARVPEEEIAQRVARVFDFRVAAILRRFRLRDLPAEDPQGFYRRLAAYGHVGRPDIDLPWEATDKVDELRG